MSTIADTSVWGRGAQGDALSFVLFRVSSSIVRGPEGDHGGVPVSILP